MARIKQLKIGPLIYRVKYKKNLVSKFRQSETLWGEIRYGDQVIAIEKGISEDNQLITLFHEGIHGILSQLGYDNQDEQMISALAVKLVELLKDNPVLVDCFCQIKIVGPEPTRITYDQMQSYLGKSHKEGGIVPTQ
jgi:hypothetical protein